MKQSSFWEQDSFLRPYDLIVIGAGITGLSSALFFKRDRPNARVLIVDKGAIPEGASTRNAGFTCVGSITEHVADMAKETEQNIKARIARRYKGLMLLRSTLGDQAISYENCGGYELFTEKDSFQKAVSHIPRFNAWMEELTGEDEVYQPQKLNGYDVIYNRLEGAIHPGRMMQELIANVQQQGVTIRWNTPVKKVDREGIITIGDGTQLQANQLLLACNGFTKRLMPEIEITPARGLVMVSEPWANMPWRGTFNYDRGYVYFRHIQGRLLLGGGRNVAVEEETLDEFGRNDKIRTYLQALAREKLHLPKALSFEYEWSGIMGFTSTKTPVLKRLGDRCAVAAGLSGMGIAIGMEVGREAAKILGKT